MRTRGLAALALWGGTVAITAASLWLMVATHGHLHSDGSDNLALNAVNSVAFLTISGVAALMVWRLPGSRVAAGMALVSVGFPLEDLATGWGHYALNAHPGLPGGVAAAWFEQWTWLLTYGALPFLFFVFPDGKFVSPLWRRLGYVAAGNAALTAVLLALQKDALDGYPGLANPLGVLPLGQAHNGDPPPPVIPFFLLAQFGILAGVVSLGVRYRRGDEVLRQQLKWVAWATGIFAAYLLTGLVGHLTNGVSAVTLDWLGALTPVVIPVAVGMAVFRRGLYAVDRLIRNTVTYAVLTGTLFGVYIGCIALANLVVGSRSQVAVAASTLAAAAAFQPLRRRVQQVVDRRFDRARYDARKCAERFAAGLRDEARCDRVAGQLAAVLQETVAPSAVSLWLAGDGY